MDVRGKAILITSERFHFPRLAGVENAGTSI